jgi:hypothetical protein
VAITLSVTRMTKQPPLIGLQNFRRVPKNRHALLFGSLCSFVDFYCLDGTAELLLGGTVVRA